MNYLFGCVIVAFVALEVMGSQFSSCLFPLPHNATPIPVPVTGVSSLGVNGSAARCLGPAHQYSLAAPPYAQPTLQLSEENVQRLFGTHGLLDKSLRDDGSCVAHDGLTMLSDSKAVRKQMWEELEDLEHFYNVEQHLRRQQHEPQSHRQAVHMPWIDGRRQR
ncbi:MAG: hypothetical protein MHM6MM_005757 [Cercozoa sp. M6MM]